jgi:primary-amine oxidase
VKQKTGGYSKQTDKDLSFPNKAAESCQMSVLGVDVKLSPIWVTKYQDRRLFPVGDYTNQSLGDTDIKSWLSGSREKVRSEDIVIWHTYRFTHNPRVEDFPIMPGEMAQIRLSPYNFCLSNPANDVPPSAPKF